MGFLIACDNEGFAFFYYHWVGMTFMDHGGYIICTPGTALGSMVKIYSKPGKWPMGLSLKRFSGLCHIWNGYTFEDHIQ